MHYLWSCIASVSSSLIIQLFEESFLSNNFFVAGFFVTVWITAVIFKSNDILRKQTALKVVWRVFQLLKFLEFKLTLQPTYFLFPSDDLISCFFLQGERKNYILFMIFIGFMFQVIGIYWWFRSDDILYPLLMIPPSTIPPFWHAVFIILVNGMYLISHYCACFVIEYNRDFGFLLTWIWTLASVLMMKIPVIIKFFWFKFPVI